MGFKDLFAIGSNLEVLKKKNERHTDKVATIHQNTDECETVSYASLLTNLAELITLVTAALFMIHRYCRTGKVDITDVEARTTIARPAALLGDQRSEGRLDATTGAREATSPNEELLKMCNTALWIEKGMLCSRIQPTDPRSKKNPKFFAPSIGDAEPHEPKGQGCHSRRTHGRTIALRRRTDSPNCLLGVRAQSTTILEAKTVLS